MMTNKHPLPNMTKRGFTIVELLIVIVVIGILAAITIVAYNGIQERARDVERESDAKALQKAMELYYADNGHYINSYRLLNSHAATTMQNHLKGLLHPDTLRAPGASESTNQLVATMGRAGNKWCGRLRL